MIEALNSEKKGLFKNQVAIFNIPILWFGMITILALVAMYTNNLPKGLIGGLLILMVLGELFGWLGDHAPIIKSYLGGGSILAIFGAAFMVYTGVMPTQTIDLITEFMQDGGFLNFYIAALITGSILGMDSKVLKQAGARYALPILAAVVGSVLLAGFVGLIIGYGFKEAVLIIAMPIMGGGMGAGAVPMAQVYSEVLGNNASYYMSILVPALALGNVFAIVLAGLLNKLGQKFPKLTGNGQLMTNYKIKSEKTFKLNFGEMGVGVIAALSFYLIGQLLGVIIPLHPYALMIITVAVFKLAGLLPEIVESGANQWYQFVAKNWTYGLLIGIGVAYTDIGAVINALTLEYILLIASVVIGAALGGGLVGKLVGFYPIEAAITAGLCMANMGGTGDVAVLSAARRMELMPFAQISSRLGGTLILLIAGLIVPML